MTEATRARPVTRIAVIGTTGSGKTTLARTLAQRLGLRHIELDALFWGPNWTAVEPEVFRHRIREAIAAAPGGWVTDGNYRGHTALITWVQADAIVWLDYPIWRVYKQLFLRTTARAFTGVELWSGNKESLRTAFLSNDSLFVWALKSHWRHRREWQDLLAGPEYAHLRVLRLRSPGARDRFLAALPASTAYADECLGLASTDKKGLH
jgi:adenylate kinase family enzyme